MTESDMQHDKANTVTPPYSRRRFIWMLSLMLSLGFLATSLIGYKVARDSVSEQIADNTLPLTSDNIYSEIQQDLLRPVFISSLMAHDTFVRDWTIGGETDPDQLVRYLHEIQQKYHTVTAFFVSEQSRNYYHSSGVLKQISRDDPVDAWYFRVRQLPAGEEYEVNVDIDTADRQSTTVFVNYRAYDYVGQLIGVTGVGLAVESVRKLIEEYQQRYGRRVYFVDRNGRVKLHGSGFSSAETIHDHPGLARIADQVLATPGGSFTYRNDGRVVYLNSRLVTEFDWYLMVEQDETETEQRLINTLLFNLLLSFVVITVVLFLVHLIIGNYRRQLEQMASIDKLTGAMNRQVFEHLFEHMMRSAKRRGQPLSVVMLDLDHFKRVNDSFGHLLGDRVLQQTVAMMLTGLRESDTLGRWGGEEFVVLLPDCNLEQATLIANKIRARVAAMVVQEKGLTINVTVSLGVARFDGQESSEQLLDRADQALYQAKAAGRNKVVSDDRGDSLPGNEQGANGQVLRQFENAAADDEQA